MKHIVGNVVQQVTTGVILHQVNCQGVMGSGIAKELRETYPVVWMRYKKKCDDDNNYAAARGAMLLGQAQLVQVSDALWVANLFGQQFYGRDGRRYTSYDALDTCLSTLSRMLPEQGLSPADCHHPLIGSGLGGGNWNVVKSIIEHHLGHETTLWTLE